MRVSDAEALHELFHAFEVGNGLSYRTSLDEVTHNLQDPDIDLENDSLVSVDESGKFGAAAQLSVKSSATKHRAFITTLARPGHSDLEDVCIRWSEDRSRELLAALPERERTLRAWADGAMPARIAQYERSGFSVSRYFVEMIRPLSEPIPEVELPEGTYLIPWDRERDDQTLDASNAAFEDHWGTVAMDQQTWRRELEYPGVRLDLSTMVIADDDVVAFSLVGMYPEDWDVTGRREAWVERIGTVRPWRKRGIATALLTDAMHRIKGEGLDYVALGVDADSPTGAFGLYVRSGFTESNRSVALTKPW